MGLIPNIFLIGVSVIFLVLGAEELVKSLTAIAKRLKVSDIFIAMTLVAIGTSLPEISAHIIGSIQILSDNLSYKTTSAAVLGANIGSDVIQQTLVIGIIVILLGTLKFEKEVLWKNFLPMIGTTLLTLILCFDGTLSRFDGGILLGCFLIYTYYLYKSQRKITHRHYKRKASKNLALDSVKAALGMAAILISAYIALSSTQEIVQITGLGGSLIGVVSLGVAAAFPEMFTAISGIKHKATGISLGTLIGSNITNPLLGIGLGSLISTYWVPRALYLWDLPMETITATLLLIYLLFNKRKLGKWGGVYLICLYIAYLIIRFMFFAVD